VFNGATGEVPELVAGGVVSQYFCVQEFLQLVLHWAMHWVKVICPPVADGSFVQGLFKKQFCAQADCPEGSNNPQA
jgi:hypothetical protein